MLSNTGKAFWQAEAGSCPSHPRPATSSQGLIAELGFHPGPRLSVPAARGEPAAGLAGGGGRSRLTRLSPFLCFAEVQFRPYRTDDFITRLYYETPRLTVLNQTWVLKARVNDSERNPNLSCKRTLSFQLILKSKINSPMECSFLLLEGPYDDVKIHPVIYHFVFSNENNETDYMALPIVDSVECNKLLAAKNINLRLFIFQIQK